MFLDRLADKGHEVFGLEFSEIGILDFFKENELPFTQSKFGPFVEYKVFIFLKVL